MSLIPGLMDKLERLKSSNRPRRGQQTSRAAPLPDQGGGGGGSKEDVDEVFQRVGRHIYLMT